MRDYIRFLAAAFMMIVAVSCDEPFSDSGSGDTGDNGAGGSVSVVNTLPYVAPEDRVVAREEFGNIYYYKYDQQGRLSEISCCRSHYSGEDNVSVETTTFSYEGLLVKSREAATVYKKIGENNSLAESAGKDTYICEEDLANIRWTEGILGASGRLTAVSHYRNNHDWVHDEYTKYCSGSTAYTYNAEGNLAGVIETEFNLDGSQDGSPDSYLYSWKDGNVEYIEADVRYTFSFLDKEYVWPGVNIYYDLDVTDFYGDVELTGLDGMKWANLLDKVSAINPETNKENYVEMVYTYDTKGRVKTVNYKFVSAEEEFYPEESDAVTFYYGDEVLPDPPVSVPVYLVRQEYVGHEMTLHKLDSGSGYLADPGRFDINIKLRNIFSDGSTVEYMQVNSGEVSVSDWPLPAYSEITRAELNELRSFSESDLSVSRGQNDWGEECWKIVCSYPVIGDIELPVVFSYDNSDPQKYSLYNPSDGQTMATHWLDIFTSDYLRSIMKVSWTLSQNESYPSDSWECWILEQTIKWNLWPDSGIEDASVTVTKDLYVPVE